MKKFLALCLSLVMCASFVACDNGDDSKEPKDTTAATGDDTTVAVEEGKDVSLKVWGPQEDQALLEELAEEFKAANPENNYTFEFGVVGEGDAKGKYLEDPEAAADVFSFANDQLYELVQADGLYEITRNKDEIIAANDAASVDAATLNDKLYAYPMTSDNGYFMYYDKSFFTEDDVKSFETMLDKADAAGKQVYMDIGNGWYVASFFFGAGCTLAMDGDTPVCDFNNENGVKAGEAIKAITAHPAFISGDGTVLQGGMGSSIVAGVSGTWDAQAMKDALGDNYAATKLPTVKMGDEDVQLGSFSGHKLVGINTMTAFPEEAMKFAEFITSEEAQIKRYNARGAGPSNLNAAASEDIKSNVALSALAAQAKYATAQKAVPSNFWDAGAAFGSAMYQQDYSMSVQEQLDALVEQVLAE